MTSALIVEAPTHETHRVTLRWQAPDGARDVVGHVLAGNPEWLVVLPEDRPAVWIPQSEVRNLRRVPERVVLPASGADALERVLDRTWPGTRRARLGGWLLRQGQGATKRANSILASGDPGASFEDAYRAAQQWAAGPPLAQVIIGSEQQAAGRAAGMKLEGLSHVMVLDIDEARVNEVPGVTVADDPDERWLALWGHGSEEGRLAELRAAPATYLRVADQAIGRVAFFGQWAVLAEIRVAVASRGKGLGRQITRALISHSAASGAKYLALQVEQVNEVAVRLYESLGFVEHHRYGYLRFPA